MLEKLQTFEEFLRIKTIKFYKNGMHRLERVIKANLDQLISKKHRFSSDQEKWKFHAVIYSHTDFVPLIKISLAL